jgi:neutral ceramidase
VAGRTNRKRGAIVAGVLAAVAMSLPLPAGADAASRLKAGAGRADITPPTGFYMFGWVRSDARSVGQHTRLFARTIVLERGGEKVALVSADLGAVPNGLVVDAVERVKRLGFTEENVIVSTSHTHSAPAGYFNFPAFNTVAPTTTTPTDLELSAPADERLYTFLVARLAKSIRRADRDVGPAVAGWGSTKLLGTTENRSIEAHLANHGIEREVGEGSVALDPAGYAHTISPRVEVLRVDKVGPSGQVPIGTFSTFANHGTVVKPAFTFYNADHHGSAARIVEAAIRKRGDVPPGQEVVNSYGNSDEGDVTAGLEHSGPAGAHEVGREEAHAMLRAWSTAGKRMSPRLALHSRWTRSCFCGRDTAAGVVDDRAVVGFPFLTGSEENRGPLYDETGIPFEGYRLPTDSGPQGSKVQAIGDTGQFPTAVPLTAIQVGSRAIVTIPGEMSIEMGRRLREATLAAGRRAGIKRVVVSGLANDFIQYFTTPEEYGMQHYEGGTMLFGEAAGVFIQERLVELIQAIGSGRPAPQPDSMDPRNGVTDDAPPYPPGASTATANAQPGPARRLGHASFSWQGGSRGFDRPLDRAFVTTERRTKRGWRRVDDDLGLRIRWAVSEEGAYEAIWEPALGARPGSHRFVVTGNEYTLRSAPFALKRSQALEPLVTNTGPGEASIELHYPHAVENEDLTWRPHKARPARPRVTLPKGVSLSIRGRKLRVKGPQGTTFRLPAGALRDARGNTARAGVTVSF